MNPLSADQPGQSAGLVGGRVRSARPVLLRPVSLLLAALAGGCFWLAFPDVGAWPMVLAGVGLLWLAFTLPWLAGRSSGRRPGLWWNVLLGLVAGCVFFAPHVWFVAVATAVVPWVALVLLQAAFWAALGMLWALVLRAPVLAATPWRQALLFAALFTGAEQWRSSVPFSGFPWGRLAWAVAGATPGRAAWLGGSVLVTFLLSWVAMLVFAPVATALTSRLWAGAGRRSFTKHQGEPQGLPAMRRGRPWIGQAWLRAAVGLLAALGLLFAPALLPLPSAGMVEVVADPPVNATIVPGDRSKWVDAGIAAAEAGVLRLGLAQGNVIDRAGDDSWPPQFTGENAALILQSHVEATMALAADARDRGASGIGSAPGSSQTLDVVVWPEIAVAWNPAEFPTVARTLDETATEVDAALLVGSMEYPETGGRFNVMLAWEPGVGVVSRYAKRLPVPFGEYIPMRRFARLLTDQVDRLTVDMLAGDDPPVLTAYAPRLGREVVYGVGICFESAYDKIFLDAARRGAEVMVVPTNNASFGVTPQSTQQLQMVGMQAITTGRAAVQVSTMGVSGVFTPDGKLVARTGLWVQDRVSALVPLRTSRTPAAVVGMAPAYLFQAAAFAIPLAAIMLIRKRYGDSAAECPVDRVSAANTKSVIAGSPRGPRRERSVASTRWGGARNLYPGRVDT